MVKVKNVTVNGKTISMDCLKNGSENDCYHIILDKDTLELMPGIERNPYVCRAIAMARRYQKKTGTIPSEFVSVWH